MEQQINSKTRFSHLNFKVTCSTVLYHEGTKVSFVPVCTYMFHVTLSPSVQHRCQISQGSPGRSQSSHQETWCTSDCGMLTPESSKYMISLLTLIMCGLLCELHFQHVSTVKIVSDDFDFVYHSHILKNLGIQYFTMRDIDRLGIQRVMEVTFDHLLAR